MRILNDQDLKKRNKIIEKSSDGDEQSLIEKKSEKTETQPEKN